jgi:PAS domain S-box-containing protein
MMGDAPDKNARVPTQLLKQCLTAAPCSCVVTDCRHKNNPVVFVNQAFEELNGYKAREVLGKHCRFLLGKDREQESLEQIREALKSGRRCTAVLRNCRKDGSLFYNELSIAPIGNRSGKPTHFIWLQRDVTGLIEAEQEMAALITEKEGRFSAYMENANEAIWRIDFEPPISLDAPQSQQVQEIFSKGVFKEANDGAARTYGLAKGKEVIGRYLGEFMKQSDQRNVETAAELVRKKFRVNNLLSHEKVSDGTTVAILNNIVPNIREGKVRHIWGSSLDISELFGAQEELKRSQKELAVQKKSLEEKNVALKELIAQIELEKKDLKDRIMANVEQVIMPTLEKIRLSNGPDTYLEQHRKALEELTSSFGRKIADSRVKLTPREIEVCNMVKNGLTNKEISRLLSIALHTVEKHRRMARNKLGLANKGINLRTYLSAL